MCLRGESQSLVCVFVCVCVCLSKRAIRDIFMEREVGDKFCVYACVVCVRVFE